MESNSKDRRNLDSYDMWNLVPQMYHANNYERHLVTRTRSTSGIRPRSQL